MTLANVGNYLLKYILYLNQCILIIKIYIYSIQRSYLHEIDVLINKNQIFIYFFLNVTFKKENLLEKFLETNMVVRIAPFNLRLALNFFRQSTVS